MRTGNCSWPNGIWCHVSIQDGLGQFCFLIFVAYTLFSGAFLLWFVPETKGRTMVEIMQDFNHLNYKNTNPPPREHQLIFQLNFKIFLVILTGYTSLNCLVNPVKFALFTMCAYQILFPGQFSSLILSYIHNYKQHQKRLIIFNSFVAHPCTSKRDKTQ